MNLQIAAVRSTPHMVPRTFTAPRVTAPRVTAPRVTAPRTYTAPRVYSAPRVQSQPSSWNWGSFGAGWIGSSIINRGNNGSAGSTITSSSSTPRTHSVDGMGFAGRIFAAGAIMLVAVVAGVLLIRWFNGRRYY